MKPLEITTTTHPMALMSYLMLAILGFATLADITRSPSLEGILGGPGHIAWGAVLMTCGLLAALAAITARGFKNPSQAIVVEAANCLVIAVCLVIYLYAIRDMNATFTKVAFSSFAISSVARVIQVAWERSKINRARKVNAKIETLADPKE